MNKYKPNKSKPKISKMSFKIWFESPYRPEELEYICRKLLYSSIQPGELATLISFKN